MRRETKRMIQRETRHRQRRSHWYVRPALVAALAVAATFVSGFYIGRESRHYHPTLMCLPLPTAPVIACVDADEARATLK